MLALAVPFGRSTCTSRLLFIVDPGSIAELKGLRPAVSVDRASATAGAGPSASQGVGPGAAPTATDSVSLVAPSSPVIIIVVGCSASSGISAEAFPERVDTPFTVIAAFRSVAVALTVTLVVPAALATVSSGGWCCVFADRARPLLSI